MLGVEPDVLSSEAQALCPPSTTCPLMLWSGYIALCVVELCWTGGHTGQYWLCHPLAVWPWPSHLASLNCLICRKGITGAMVMAIRANIFESSFCAKYWACLLLALQSSRKHYKVDILIPFLLFTHEEAERHRGEGPRSHLSQSGS